MNNKRQNDDTFIGCVDISVTGRVLHLLVKMSHVLVKMGHYVAHIPSNNSKFVTAVMAQFVN
jgi:hypothetical protein